MPISPYSGQLYSGYTIGRPYTSSTRLTSNYSDSPSGYKLLNSSSSSAFRPTNPVRKPILLAGNTAALKKTFSDASVAGLTGDSAVSFHDNSSSLRRYNGVPSYNLGSRRDINDNSTDRGYNTNRRTTLLSDIKENNKTTKYESTPYIPKYGSYFSSREEENQRPKDIDTRQINVSGKYPSSQQSTLSDIKRGEQESSSISRNRQVVRLTIKREKEKEKRPLVLPENSVKTIAQKLFEKYTIIDKKKDSPIPYIPKTKELEASLLKPPLPKLVDKPPKLPLLKDNLSNVYSVIKVSKEDDENDGDDELSDEDEIEIVKKEKDAAAKCFVRATKAATTDKELDTPQEVKDAIIAAVLHPGIDIESDEEIKKLMEEESDNETCNSTKKNIKSRENINIDSNFWKKREKSDSEMGGEMIVDQLKRFVKQQVSIKKQSLKNVSRKSSKEKLEGLTQFNPNSNKDNIIIYNNNTNNNKPKERIIPIIFQEQINSALKEKPSEEINYNNKRGSKVKINSTLLSEGSINAKNLNERNDCNKSTSKMSLPSEEKKSKIKTDKESLSKSFEPVYQTTQEEVSEVLPRPFQTSFQVSGEHSITHPENKVPAASIFITDSVPDRKGTGKEILLSDLNIHGKKGEGNETKAKPLLKGIKNSEFIINDYESELGGKGKKTCDDFQSAFDNSIKSESSQKERKLKIFDPKEQELSYDIEKENKNKEFKERKIESENPYLKRESAISYLEDDTKEIMGAKIKSNVSDIKDEKQHNLDLKFDIGEIQGHHASLKHHSLVKGMPMNSASKVTNSKNKSENEWNKDKNDNNELENTESKLQLEKASLPLTKSKTTFLKSLVAQNASEILTKQLGVKQFDLKKSATTQNVTEANCGKKVNITTDNDPESSTSNYFQDLEIKPSLKLFLEEEEKETVEEVSSSEKNLKLTLSAISTPETGITRDGVAKSDEPTKPEEVSHKKSLKRPKEVVPSVEDKSIHDEILKARNVLKRTTKREEVPKQKTESTTLELKPGKVWRKPLPPKDTSTATSNANLSTPSLNKSISESKSNFNLKSKSSKPEEEPKSLQLVKTEPLSLKYSPSNSKLESLKTSERINSKSSKNKPQAIIDIPKQPDISDKPYALDSKFNTKLSSLEKTEDKEQISSLKSNDNEEVKHTLSTSHSADSAYGSSPSTPHPRGATLIGGKRISEEENESPNQLEKEETAVEINNEICELCGTNCHKKCEKQMANLCGVNQKLLAEALSSVKKDGKDSFRVLPTAVPSSKSASSVSSTEGDTTTTDDEETETDTDSSEYNGPAEVRSPIQTKPKYKKYGIDDFNFIKVLGKGSFGKVMLAQQVSTENYFAVKCLKKDVVLEDNDVECCLIERKVLTLGTKHPYLCHLFCSFQTPSHLFFVMEYLTGGDLMFHIQRVGRFDEYRACFYAAEITSGLKFLHNKGIIYRDLKLDNILLDYQGHIRIADFGMCKLQIYLDRFADTFCGTPDYMAPEVIKGLHYNQCVDWWSFGVLLYEMMVGKSPFKGCDEDHLFWLICNEEPFYPRFLSREAQSLLKQLLEKDATRRLGPPYCQHGEIQCHTFFKYIDWSKIERKEVETPYKPRLRHILDVQYFDRLFTKRNAAITPLDDSILDTMDQTPFKEFSYTNPNITD